MLWPASLSEPSIKKLEELTNCQTQDCTSHQSLDLIKLAHLDKPTRIGVYAVNSLEHLPSAYSPPLQKRINAYKFITDFNSDEAPKINLLEQVSGLQNIINGGGNLVDRFANTFASLGFVNKPPITRIYPLDGEVRAGVSKVSPDVANPDPFDREEAGAETNTMSDHFLAGFALRNLSLDIHNARDALRKSKRGRISKSLHASSFIFLEENPDKCPHLIEYVKYLKNGEALDTTEFQTFRDWLRTLYQDCLLQEEGIVGARPARAGGTLARLSLKPDLVFVDEA
ncbi:hypothetical protein NW762_012265 [Fusarium torreyae]|uniref:Uncharacterized protein n=1 Tax=Fusarium torreyae TaxID=1237075 RepID=A0A9W8V8V1_9HYPO|nr:hypothetical protein NW762_012265 [Fusarium torreyae]